MCFTNLKDSQYGRVCLLKSNETNFSVNCRKILPWVVVVCYMVKSASSTFLSFFLTISQILGGWWLGWSNTNEFLNSCFCSCGTCGYELNLSSSNRSISSIGSKYGKSIRRGIISFFNVDDSRFTHADEIECAPFFAKHSWGLFRKKTKLLCRKCCNHVGYAYNDHTSSSFPLLANGAQPSPATEASNRMKYDIRIRALQPSSQEYGITESAWHFKYVVKIVPFLTT